MIAVSGRELESSESAKTSISQLKDSAFSIWGRKRKERKKERKKNGTEREREGGREDY